MRADQRCQGTDGPAGSAGMARRGGGTTAPAAPLENWIRGQRRETRVGRDQDSALTGPSPGARGGSGSPRDRVGAAPELGAIDAERPSTPALPVKSSGRGRAWKRAGARVSGAVDTGRPSRVHVRHPPLSTTAPSKPKARSIHQTRCRDTRRLLSAACACFWGRDGLLLIGDAAHTMSLPTSWSGARISPPRGTLYPTLGIGRHPPPRYPQGWLWPRRRINPVTLSTPSFTRSSASTLSRSCGKPPTGATAPGSRPSSSASSGSS